MSSARGWGLGRSDIWINSWVECFFLSQSCSRRSKWLDVKNIVIGGEIGLDHLRVLLRFSDSMNVKWMADRDSKIQNSERGRALQWSVPWTKGVSWSSGSLLMSVKWPSPPGAQSELIRYKWGTSEVFGKLLPAPLSAPWFSFSASSVFSIVLIWCVFSETSVKGTLKKIC